MVFTYGLLVIIANGLYLLFSILVGVGIYLLLKKNGLVRWKGFISTTAFLVVLLTPFYDLIIQMGIKTYYQNFKINDTVYAYPEKDANGKIESLGIGKEVRSLSSGYLSTEEKFSYLKKKFPIKDFIECYMSHSFLVTKTGDDKKNITYDYKHDMGLVRTHISKENINYELLNNENGFSSRYQILGKEEKHLFYTRKNIKMWDKNKNILLAEGLALIFPPGDSNKFRYKYLLWKNANGYEFRIEAIDNYNLIFKKTFGFKLISWMKIKEG